MTRGRKDMSSIGGRHDAVPRSAMRGTPGTTRTGRAGDPGASRREILRRLREDRARGDRS
ncbi:DUF6243 family protein [Marinactinospora thermotolerans]|uniref:Uncharacterized protein n=1 Tax=Marinactinospora thermotolerans DSM 45154 TaxID=1122192 RepID=A0A1T4T2U4_9ACTN|nr:hypothetical protein [Marinactinospora thermotolerans]SKA34762.1 hypothetical protein SAMN02745673_04378 [Marinactinospora thermotolerans DSM 45154]